MNIEGENNLKKSSYYWIGFFSLWLMVISSPFSSGSGLAYLFGKFIGSFIFIYACVWVMSKVKSVLKNLLSKRGIKKPAQ